MKIYSKEELKHSRVFFDKTPPKFGTYFVMFVTVFIPVCIALASVVTKPYIVKAEGIVTTVDNQYLSPVIAGNIVEIKVKEGERVKVGDVVLVISNGEETERSSAIQSQLEILTEKETALKKYLSGLEQKTNNLTNEGFEIEYHNKLQYYLSQLENTNRVNKLNEKIIKEKKDKREILKTEISVLKDRLEATQKEVNEPNINDEDFSIKDKEKNTSDNRNEKISNLFEDIDGKTNQLERTVEEIEQFEQQNSMNSQAESTRLQLVAEAGQNQTILSTQRAELESQWKTYTNQESLFEIVASNEGLIHYLAPLHIGLGIQQGQVFAEISNNEDIHKIVEAYLPAKDRSKVEVGNLVNVNVQGVNSTQYGMLRGEILTIDTGTITQETTRGNQIFYRIQVTVNSFKLKGGGAGDIIEVLKSMPVQAQIVYDEETYLMWLLDMLNLKT